MKRKGKCTGKRKYPFRDTAIDMARWKFVNHGIELGVYECPTCLDFHLTSKYCNLKSNHREWLAKKDSWSGTYDSIKKMRKTQRRQIKRSKTQIKPNPKSKTQLAKQKKKEYKDSIIPLAKQREILSKIDNQKLSTPNPFWLRILDII